MTHSRILFAVRNPDASSQPALAKAIQIARAEGATLELFHALTRVLFVDTGKFDADAVRDLTARVESDARAGLERMAAVARKHGVTTDTNVCWDQPAHDAIVRRAEAGGAGLVIAEWHRGTRTRPWLVHLTDWELLRTCPVPVLLVKTAKPYRRPLLLGAVDPSHAHAKPSALDTRILAAGDGLARALRGRLQIMHASYPSIVGADVGGAARKAAMAWTVPSLEELEAQSREAFDAFRESAGFTRARAHLVTGNPVTEIPRLAKKLRADIVVMGALSRSGLARVFIGNTAERVLGSLPCDVLVVKPAS